jgi:hypothetical protein
MGVDLLIFEDGKELMLPEFERLIDNIVLLTA